MSDVVLYDFGGGIARIRFNRPKSLNVLDLETALAFEAAARRAVENPETRAILLSGTGRAFMAGGDIAYFHKAEDPRASLVSVVEPAHAALKLLMASPAIVIAAVQGPTASAGMSIALGADLCVAADDLSMTFAYPKVGGPGDCGGTWVLPHIVGLRRAMEIALLSERLDASTALTLGLVCRVVATDMLESEAEAMAQKLAAGPPLAQGRMKALLRRAEFSDYGPHLDAEATAFSDCAGTEDFREAIAAFFEKRIPRFTGRCTGKMQRNSMQDAYIAAYIRSPFTFANKGALASVRPDDLGAHVIRALLAQTCAPGEEIEDVVWGCAFPEGEQGLNIGRVVGMLAGLPHTVGGATVNRWCGSSIQAVQMAAGMMLMGVGEAFIAGGTESMSRVPLMGFNPTRHDSWSQKDADDYMNVGLTAERVARQYGLSRENQDEFAFSSHRKARAAQLDGRLASEIAPYDATSGIVAVDGCVRETGLEKLASLKPVFLEDGTVTAGSSSPMTDGATAVLVCSEAFAKRHSMTPLARVAGFAVSSCAPGVMGLGPIESSRKAMQRAGLAIGDIDIVEMNEAFASQAEACRRTLEIDPEKLNIDGGALALGHPLGATGTRLVGKAATLLQREGKKHALVS